MASNEKISIGRVVAPWEAALDGCDFIHAKRRALLGAT